MISNSAEIEDMGSENSSQLMMAAQLPQITHHMYDVLVLDAKLRQSLASVRSLGKRGYSIAALETSNVPAFSSRWCQQSFLYPEDLDSLSYLAYLENLLDRTGARVLIASSDGTIALIRQHRERIESRTRIALAKEPALAIAINKERTLSIAAQIGLNIPQGIVLRSVEEVPTALKEIGLPAVVKPVESWVSGNQRGVLGRRIAPRLVATPDEARIAVDELTSNGGTVLFQQVLSGRREAVSFFYANHKIYARFAQWAKRTEPPLGGTSVLRQSIAIPEDIGVQAERLIREIDLEGYSEVEFRRDDAGIPYLMEINPRLSASVEIATRSGVDFPYLLYQWASGERIEPVESYRTGKWMRYLKGDIMTTIAALQQQGQPGIASPTQTMLGFWLSFLQPMGYDYLDWSDLTPALKAMTSFTRSWIGGAIIKRLSHMKMRTEKF